MSRELKEFISEAETLAGRINQAIKMIRSIEDTDQEILQKCLNPNLLDSLVRIRKYLEDPEMQEIIRVNEYQKENRDEDFFGNFVNITLPSIKRFLKNNEYSPELAGIVEGKINNFIKYLEHFSKAKLRAA